MEINFLIEISTSHGILILIILSKKLNNMHFLGRHMASGLSSMHLKMFLTYSVTQNWLTNILLGHKSAQGSIDPHICVWAAKNPHLS